MPEERNRGRLIKHITFWEQEERSEATAGACTCERRRLAQRAVLVVHVRGALLGAERRGRGQHQLLLDEAGLGVILRELLEPLLQGAAQEVQTLGRLAQTALGLQRGRENGKWPPCSSLSFES